jgi:hypothetical protein
MSNSLDRTRRGFLKQTAAGSLALSGLPGILRA